MHNAGTVKMADMLKDVMENRLSPLSIEELEELRPLWIEELKKSKAPEGMLAIANDLIDLVIADKTVAPAQIVDNTEANVDNTRIMLSQVEKVAPVQQDGELTI